MARGQSKLLLGCLIMGLMAGHAWSQATDLKPDQAIEVREGDLWSGAKYVRKEGRKLLIKYNEGGTEEWVTADRVRPPGGAPLGKPADAKPGNDANPGDAKPATNPANADKPKEPGRATYQPGANLEAKWGGLWRKAKILNKRTGDWYLVAYDGGQSQEWVEWWRFRQVGSTEDTIPYARPNSFYRKGDNPPRADAGEPSDDNPRRPGRAPNSGGGNIADAKPKDSAPAFDKPITKADLDGAKEIVPAFSGEGWTVPVDPTDAKPISGEAVALKSTVNNMRLLRCGTFLLATPGSDFFGKPEFGTCDRVNLAGGSVMGPINFSPQSYPLAISPSGKLILSRSTSGPSRLDVWRLGAIEPEHVISFETGKSSERGPFSAGFVDEEHAYTAMGTEVVFWEISKAKAIWRANFESITRSMLSAGGKQLYVIGGADVICMDVLTGKVLGAIELPSPTSGGVDINPEGTRMVCFSGGAVTIVDLKEGKALGEIATNLKSGVNNQVVALSEDYALLGSGYLFDLNKKVFVWSYQGSSDVMQVGGRCWAVVQTGQRRTLVTAKLPHEAARKAGARTAPASTLLKAGDKVALDINIEATDEQRKAITASLTSQIEKNGWVVDPGAPVHLVARTENGKTTQERYRSFGSPFGGEEVVSVTEKITRLAVESEGKPAWESRTVNTAGMFVHGKQGQSIAEMVSESNKFNVEFLKSVHIPQTIMKGEMPEVGKSSWALGGVKDAR